MAITNVFAISLAQVEYVSQVGKLNENLPVGSQTEG